VGRFAALVEEQGEDIRARQVVLPHVDGVRSTGEDMLTDAVMLQLRKGGGLRLRERIVDRFERGDVIASVIRQAVAEHIQRGLVEVIEEVEQVDASGRKQVTEVVVRLTDPDGFLMSNDVISDIFLALDELKFD
jgi:oxygen-independent coproporphyrinogen-3 oxidase